MRTSRPAPLGASLPSLFLVDFVIPLPLLWRDGVRVATTTSDPWRLVTVVTSRVAEGARLCWFKLPIVTPVAQRQLENAVSRVAQSLAVRLCGGGLSQRLATCAHRELPDAVSGVEVTVRVLGREAFVVV